MTPTRRRFRSVRNSRNNSSYVIAAAVSVGALITAALFNQSRAKKAEQDNPPAGNFITVDGVRLHYIERGSGEPLVLLHGNGSMIQDFESSGLIDMAAPDFRVIVFDRPGFGHSERNRNVVWTPDAQASLIKRALEELDVSSAIVLGHSWGASVAVAMGLKYPSFVRGLVLASGYYYPTVRSDVVLMSAPAIPGVGDILGNTLAPIISRLMWPLMISHLFSPARVPRTFERFPKEMALRPSQLRASAGESALMIPDAYQFRNRYPELTMPVVIIAGEEDKLINIEEQSARLHSEIAQSKLHRVPDAGHMVHQTGTRQVMSAIHEAESSAPARV